jgi:hypothetical protein
VFDTRSEIDADAIFLSGVNPILNRTPSQRSFFQ